MNANDNAERGDTPTNTQPKPPARHWSERHRIRTFLILIPLAGVLISLAGFAWSRIEDYYQAKNVHLDDKLKIEGLNNDIKTLRASQESLKEMNGKLGKALSDKDAAFSTLQNENRGLAAEAEKLKTENAALAAKAAPARADGDAEAGNALRSALAAKLQGAEEKNKTLENEVQRLKAALDQLAARSVEKAPAAQAAEARPYSYSMKDIRMGQAFIDPVTTASITVNAFWNYNTASGVLSLPDKDPVEQAFKPGQTFLFDYNHRKYRMVLSKLVESGRLYSVDVMEVR